MGKYRFEKNVIMIVLLIESLIELESIDRLYNQTNMTLSEVTPPTLLRSRRSKLYFPLNRKLSDMSAIYIYTV